MGPIIEIPNTKNKKKAWKLCIKVGDFGLAHSLQHDATHLSAYANTNLGTVIYMAPEAIHQPTEDGTKRLSKDVDIWSMGILLYQLLHNGHTPWDKFRKLGTVSLGMAIADPR